VKLILVVIREWWKYLDHDRLSDREERKHRSAPTSTRPGILANLALSGPKRLDYAVSVRRQIVRANTAKMAKKLSIIVSMNHLWLIFSRLS
jgi:hypothetical protein